MLLKIELESIEGNNQDTNQCLTHTPPDWAQCSEAEGRCWYYVSDGLKTNGWPPFWAVNSR